jgi:hypothetical protein
MTLKELVLFRLKFLAIYSRLSLHNKAISDALKIFVTRWDELFSDIPPMSSEKTVFLSFFEDIEFFYMCHQSVRPFGFFDTESYTYLTQLIRLLRTIKEESAVSSLLGKDIEEIKKDLNFRYLQVFTSPLYLFRIEERGTVPEIEEGIKYLWQSKDINIKPFTFKE